MAFHLTNRGIILADTRRGGKRGKKKKITASLSVWLWLQGVFFFFTFWLSVYHSSSKYRRVQEKKHAHLLSLSQSWRQTQTQPVILSRSIIHSLRHLIQCVSAGPWEWYCCYCSLQLSSSSSSSSSLLASVLLSRSHLLSSGNRQRHDWSAEVVDATSCHCSLWLCRN